MSIWTDMEDRGNGEVIKKEDMKVFWEYGKCRPYKGALDPKTETLLSRIYDFTGFAPFLPADILVNKGDVKVYLDEECSRTVTVSLAQLVDALHSLEDEVRSLEGLIAKLQNSPKADQGEIEKLLNRKQKLEGKIKEIRTIVSRLRATGLGSYAFEIQLLGYYTREKDSLCKKDEVPAIHLMLGTIEKRFPGRVREMTGIVFVHELMHAFFDNRNPYVEHPHCPEIEEPIAEYGMLCFMEMFERAYPVYKDIFDLAKRHVEDKQHSLGVCHYGYGGYLFKDRSDFGVDWVSLFKSVCPALFMNAPEVKAYESMISPIKYPRYERACECKLLDVLKPRRFFFSGIKSVWDSDEEEIYFTVRSAVANRLPFLMEYPRGTKVHITFHDKTYTKHFNGEATVVLNNTRFFIKNELMEEYASVFGKMDRRSFAFYEEKPSDGIHPAEWVAVEL